MTHLIFEKILLLKPSSEILEQLKAIQIPEEPNGVKLVRLPDDKLHVTLTSIANCKSIKDKLATELPHDIQIPEVILGKSGFVYRTEWDKVSYVVGLENGDEIKEFVDKLYAQMGLLNPEPDRFFHFTLANNKPNPSNPEVANPFGSIGDVKKEDIIKESVNNNYHIWFDMDGVLADFNGALAKIPEVTDAKSRLDLVISEEFPEFSGLLPDDLKSRIKQESSDPLSPVKKLKKVFWAYNNLVFKWAAKPGFFANLEMLPGAHEMLDAAKELTGELPDILTAPMGDETDPDNHSVSEKKEWCKKNLAGRYNHVECTLDKAKVVDSPNNILIDDRPKYVDVFKAAGAQAILHKTPTADNQNTWKETIAKLQTLCGSNHVSEKKYILAFESFQRNRK